MYNKNYFHTPNEVIKMMIDPIKGELAKANILEPSAGMGAICDYIKLSGANKTKIFCCEVDENMSATLKGKGYKVLHGDFLNYSGAMNFDLILMNPPFDRGADHLLKAWEVMRHGKIVCLLNEETINNPYSESRRYLSDIIAENGSVEFIGSAFDDAARKTSVGVALVRLEKVSEASSTTFAGSKTQMVEDIELSSETGEMERADFISALVRSYSMAVAGTERLFRAMNDFSLYTSAFVRDSDAKKLCASFFETSSRDGYGAAHNEFVMALQRHAWNTVFDKSRVSGMMTTKVREKFEKWREEMGGIDLNQENIMMLFDALIQQRKVIADECIVDAFDKITSYAERKAPGEKWKTNSLFMVPEKFILPWIVENSRYGGGLSIYHRAHDFLNDIDRAFCLISGKSFPVYGASKEEEMGFIKTTLDAIRDWCRDRNQPQESEFFEFKCHIKGTVHFKVKDNQLLAEFNRRACAAKGFVLPDEEKFRGKARRDQKVK